MKNFIENQKVFILSDPFNLYDPFNSIEAVFVRYLTNTEKLKISETSPVYLDCKIIIDSKEYLSNSFYLQQIH